MSAYKLITCVLPTHHQEALLLELVKYIQHQLDKKQKLIISLITKRELTHSEISHSNNLSNANHLTICSLLEIKLKEAGLECQLIEGSKLPNLTKKNRTKRWRLVRLSFRRKILSREISIVVFNKLDSSNSPKFIYHQAIFPLLLAESLKLNACDLILPNQFYENLFKEVYLKSPDRSELSYSELLGILNFSDVDYLNVEFIREAKRKKIKLFLCSLEDKHVVYQVKPIKEINVEHVYLIKSNCDVCRFVFIWNEHKALQSSLPHLFNVLSQANINTFGTQSTTVQKDHILSMFIERKNMDEANMLFEYNKTKLGYKHISQESRIGIIDIIGQKFSSSSRVMAQIATVMVNHSYPFDITHLSSNHIRVAVELDHVKLATQLLTDELI